MGSTRLILLILLTSALTVCCFLPGPSHKLHAVLDEVRWKIIGVSPDDHYRWAARYYQAGDFEKSEVACAKALRLDPNHLPARALLIEVEFILGRGKATPAPDYSQYMTSYAMIRHQQVLVEMDNCLVGADRFLAAGEPERAKKEYRKVLEYAKWMPIGVEVEQRKQKASNGLAISQEAAKESGPREKRSSPSSP